MKRKCGLTTKVFSIFIGTLTVTVLSVLSIYSLYAQSSTKQLKDPNPQKAKATAQVPENTELEKSADGKDIPSNIAAIPQGSQSYSVVIESKTGPDGKQIRTKKIWRDGKLVEETEENVEPGTEPQNDSIIELPDGFTTPGTVLRSEQFGDFPFGAAGGDPFERAEQFFKDQQKRMEAIRKQLGSGGSAAPGQVIPRQIPQQAHVTAPSQYWIGVSVRLVPEMYAVHLGLPQNTGVLVSDVLPGYAAEKAGVKKYDIIVSVMGEDINDIQEIGKVFDANGGKTIKMSIIRAGKKMDLEITPEKRPVNPGALKVIGPLGSSEGMDDDSIRIIRPGVIVPKSEADVIREQQKPLNGAGTSAPSKLKIPANDGTQVNPPAASPLKTTESQADSEKPADNKTEANASPAKNGDLTKNQSLIHKKREEFEKKENQNKK